MKRYGLWALVLVLVALVPALVFAAGDAKKGNDKYHKFCAGCHGDQGKGDGPGAGAMNPKPTDFTSKGTMTKVTDAQMVDAVLKGGAAIGKSPMMPPLKISTDDAQDIIAYVRTLAK